MQLSLLWSSKYMNATREFELRELAKIRELAASGSARYGYPGAEITIGVVSWREVEENLIHFSVIVAVCILQSGDDLGAVLYFQIRFENLDVHVFAFYRAGA